LRHFFLSSPSYDNEALAYSRLNSDTQKQLEKRVIELYIYIYSLSLSLSTKLKERLLSAIRRIICSKEEEKKARLSLSLSFSLFLNTHAHTGIRKKYTV